jgi:hypothetical protein
LDESRSSAATILRLVLPEIEEAAKDDAGGWLSVFSAFVSALTEVL